MLLADATLRQEIERTVKERLVPAENAVAHVFDGLVARFRNLGEAYFAQRAADLRDVEDRLLRALIGERTEALSRLARPVVVAAHDLTPSQAALLDRKRTLGFLTDSAARRRTPPSSRARSACPPSWDSATPPRGYATACSSSWTATRAWSSRSRTGRRCRGTGSSRAATSATARNWARSATTPRRRSTARHPAPGQHRDARESRR